MTVRGVAIDVGRVVLLVVALWVTIVVIGNVIDALVALGALPKGAPFASGNFAEVRDVLARLSLSAFAGPAFAIVIVLEAASAACLWISARHRNPRAEDVAFALLIVLFGGFVAVDDLIVNYQLEAVHRSLLAYVAVLYVVVRLTRAAPSP